jgi:hypothetical protein
VYCVALLEGEYPSSTNAIKQANNVDSAINSPYRIQVVMDGLSADTSYEVFCLIEDYNSNTVPMTLSDIIKDSIFIYTMCCGQFQWPQFQEEIRENVVSGLFIWELDTRPSGDVQAQALPAACEGEELPRSDVAPLVSPNSWQLSATAALTGEFVVSGAIGCYQLILSSYPAEGEERFSYIDDSVRLFEIIAAEAEPRSPVLVEAYFGNGGNYVYINMDGDTDRGKTVLPKLFASKFACDRLFTFNQASSYSCIWSTLRTVQVSLQPGVSPYLKVGDAMTLRASRVKAACVAGQDCTAYPYAPAASLPLLAPRRPNAVYAALAAPAQASICDDLSLDSSASYGRGAAPWRLVEWVVTSEDANATMLSDYLSTRGVGVIRVPHLILTNGTFSIVLKLTNQFNQQNARSVSVVLLPATATTPRLTLAGPSVLRRPDRFSAFASAHISTCGNNTAKIFYSFAMYLGSVLQPSLSSTSLDVRFFKLPPYSLEAGEEYTLFVNVSTRDGRPVGASMAVSVGTQGVVAVIAGGASESVSAGAVSGAATASAATSYLIDYRERPELGPGVGYHWTCTEQRPTFGASCAAALTTSVYAAETEADLGVLALLNVSEFLLTVVVNTTIDADEITDTASKLFIIVAGAPPPAIALATLDAKYNADSRIILSGSVTSFALCQGEWALFDDKSGEELPLDEYALTPLVKVLTIGNSEYMLSISRYSLTPGLSYTIRLSTRLLDTDAATGYATGKLFILFYFVLYYSL